MPIDPKSVKWDAPDPKQVQWDDAPTFGGMFKDELLRPVRAVRDLAAGAVRGAGSIGATLLTPKDALEAAIARGMGADMPAPERRNAMTEALRGMGADPESIAFGAAKIGAEIAGTAGIGSALAGGAQAMRAGPAVVNALRSGGMVTGGRGAADLALRAGAGAAVGGASAGMVDPSQAGTGALIGGALPGAISGAGKFGSAVGGAIYRAMTPEMQKQAVALAQATGRTIDEVASALQRRGPTMIPGSAKTTPQILQNETVSQVARNLQNKGNFGLVEAEKANAAARIAALERVAPTAGTINEARANAGNAVVDYAKAAEKSASQRVRNLFDAVESQDDVRMFLPIEQMEAARGKFLGRGSFGAGGGPADQAINTAKEIGTTALDAVKAAPMQKQQSLYEAVLSAGGIRKNSPSGRQLLGELKDLAASKQRGAVRANSGKSVDLLAQQMHARGFIPDEDPATLIQYLKDAGRDTFAGDADMAGQYARRAEAAMGDLPGAEILPKAVPFQEMQSLRSSIGEAAQSAKVAGNKQAAAALSEMKRAIDSKINAVVNGGALPGETFSQESANLYRKALAEHAAKKAQFNTGPQAAIFRTGSDGLPAKEGAEVAPLFWNSGNAQVENMRAFKRLTKEDQSLVKLMKSNATTEALQSSAKGPQGAMTFDAFNKWMKNHSGAAKELFSDQELATLKAIGDELRGATKAENLGRATGSNTAQNIMSNGILDNPRAQAVAQSMPMGVGKFVTGPLFNYARASGETARNNALAQLLADPELMGQQLRMYSQGRAPNAVTRLLTNQQLQQFGVRAAPVISAQ